MTHSSQCFAPSEYSPPHTSNPSWRLWSNLRTTWRIDQIQEVVTVAQTISCLRIGKAGGSRWCLVLRSAYGQVHPSHIFLVLLRLGIFFQAFEMWFVILLRCT
ncbi:hypothetical protein CC86DRAFT_176007 [Ophiobolus disseminans]|uniref:Uncharacterized protein n=1 Tax=Ophiobolus disseminans TaxID=1469910 RepID=A0A6A7AAY8_9PLEO|nr:hypothetical protein CC86DRAFT_176007 [Ophiobolus disseminans]